MGLGLGSTPLRHADPPPGTTHLLTSILWWCRNTCGSRWQRAICWVHLARGQCSGMIISSLGVVPKSTPGKFRVIIDLSRPDGHSVNDQTCRELTRVAYSSTEDAALGPGAPLAKIDIREAYRMVPVCPSERPFLAVAWQGEVYVDCQLPFGLASAPALQRHLNGYCAKGEFVVRSTIYMIFCSWERRTPLNARGPSQSLSLPALSWEFHWPWKRSKAHL